jgi:hypothetical protein
MGECAGLAWVSENTSDFYIHAFGNDPTTWQNEGLQQNEEMQFRLYRPSTKTEYVLLPTYKPETPNSDGSFATNGVSIIDNFKVSPLDVSEDISGDIAIYPNPTKGHIQITGVQTGTDYEIFNNQGVLIQQGQINTKKHIDLGKQTDGVYFLKLTAKENTKMIKLIKN